MVHPHPVAPGLAGVVHGMPVHGAGPDGEHPPHNPRRRYQNRPKPNNNLERLPLDEAAKRVTIYFNVFRLIKLLVSGGLLSN